MMNTELWNNRKLFYEQVSSFKTVKACQILEDFNILLNSDCENMMDEVKGFLLLINKKIFSLPGTLNRIDLSDKLLKKILACAFDYGDDEFIVSCYNGSLQEKLICESQESAGFLSKARRFLEGQNLMPEFDSLLVNPDRLSEKEKIKFLLMAAQSGKQTLFDAVYKSCHSILDIVNSHITDILSHAALKANESYFEHIEASTRVDYDKISLPSFSMLVASSMDNVNIFKRMIATFKSKVDEEMLQSCQFDAQASVKEVLTTAVHLQPRLLHEQFHVRELYNNFPIFSSVYVEKKILKRKLIDPHDVDMLAQDISKNPERVVSLYAHGVLNESHLPVMKEVFEKVWQYMSEPGNDGLPPENLLQVKLMMETILKKDQRPHIQQHLGYFNSIIAQSSYPRRCRLP